MAKLRLPPGPKGHWLSGNLPEMRHNRLDFFVRCAREHGDVASLRLGFRRVYLVSAPELIEQALVTQAKNFTKHFALKINSGVFGQGLLTSEGDFWLRQRRLIQPVFSRSSIAAYTADMVKAADHHVAGWRTGETRLVMDEMERLTLAIAAKTLFDADADDVAQDVGQALQTLQQAFTKRFGSLMILPRWAPTVQAMRVRRAVRRLDRIIYRFIDQRRQSGLPHPSPPGGEGQGVRGHDLLSLLLRARDEDGGGGMSDTQVRDEAMTLFLAGHETTALGLAWTWYLLARHPQAEQRLVQELHEVLAGRSPTAGDLPALRYTEQVLLESMRLFPPVYAVGREAVSDGKLGGFDMPRGTTLLMPQWSVHRDPRFFDEPLEFRPERWTDDFKRDLPKFAYFPFGGGPRICIGNTFAMIEMSLLLAAIAQRWTLELDPAIAVTPLPTFTLQPDNGIPMRLQKRDGNRDGVERAAGYQVAEQK